MSSGATKEAKLVVKMVLKFMWSKLSVFPEFQRKVGSGGLLLFGRGALPWVEPELLFFCLELEEPLPDLLSDLLELDLCLDLFPEDPEAWVSRESSPFRSRYWALIAWTSFRSPARVFGLLWWTISL